MGTPTEGNEHEQSDQSPEEASRGDFKKAQRSVFEEAELDVQSQFIDLAEPRVQTHVLETGSHGEEPPLLFVHATTWFGAYFAPLMAELKGTQMLALDRPGSGLSDNFDYTAANHRQTASHVLVGVLDDLGIEQVDLVGNSTGGYWSVVFALTHPERIRRLILLGGVATLPGTQAPLPTRLLSVPGLNRLLSRLQEPSEESVVKQMEGVGDGDSILQYPALIRAKVAHDREPRSTSVQELRSMITFRGWRSDTRLRTTELRTLQPPTMFIWGRHDWFGGPDKVRTTVGTIPDARLEEVDAGHGPWFGQPERCAQLIEEMRV